MLIIENDRQIVEDEDGLLVVPLLAETKRYLAINPTIRGWDAPREIHSILYLYHNSKVKDKIRAGCRNRIVILLKAGSDPRGLKSCPFNRGVNWADLDMSVTQYALFTNKSDLWQEALENHGWNKTDVEHLLDEEQYLGVPKLLDGELKFRSLSENRQEFLQVIATGGCSESFRDLAENLAIYIRMPSYDVQSTIEEGYRAFGRKSTPGSWHEDGVLSLVLGVDFFLVGLYFFWSPALLII